MKFTFLLILVLQASSAGAGTYTFSDTPENEEAPRIPICQDFMENLKRLGNPPMVCDRQFDPALKQFTWPRWTPIDASKHRHLVGQIWQHEFGWADDEASMLAQANPPLAQDARLTHERSKAHFAENARSGDIKLAITQVPIGGVPTTVLRFTSGEHLSCKPEDWSSSGYPSRRFFIVDRRLRTIDFAATDLSLLRGHDGYASDMRPDLFLYRGKPAIAFWYANGVGRGHIEVFKDYGNYCYIDFTSNSIGTTQ